MKAAGLSRRSLPWGEVALRCDGRQGGEGRRTEKGDRRKTDSRRAAAGREAREGLSEPSVLASRTELTTHPPPHIPFVMGERVTALERGEN